MSEFSKIIIILGLASLSFAFIHNLLILDIYLYRATIAMSILPFLAFILGLLAHIIYSVGKLFTSWWVAVLLINILLFLMLILIMYVDCETLIYLTLDGTLHLPSKGLWPKVLYTGSLPRFAWER